MIKIVGLGAGDISQISFGAVEALKSGLDIYLRTENHPIVEKLEMEYKSFDSYYDSKDTFEDVYSSIAKKIVELGKEKDIVYAVPGHPRVAEMSVSFIEEYSKEEGVELEIIPSMSFIDAMYDFIGFDPVDGFRLVDAFQIDRFDLDSDSSIIITQVCDRFIASNVKLQLMEYYDDDVEVWIVKAAGVKGLEEKKKVVLWNLDSNENNFDNLTSIYIEKNSKKRFFSIKNLVEQINTTQEKSSDFNIDGEYKKLSNSLENQSKKLIESIGIQDIDEIIYNASDILADIFKIGFVGEKQGYFDIWEIIDVAKLRLVNKKN